MHRVDRSNVLVVYCVGVAWSLLLFAVPLVGLAATRRGDDPIGFGFVWIALALAETGLSAYVASRFDRMRRLWLSVFAAMTGYAVFALVETVMWGSVWDGVLFFGLFAMSALLLAVFGSVIGVTRAVDRSETHRLP